VTLTTISKAIWPENNETKYLNKITKKLGHNFPGLFVKKKKTFKRKYHLKKKNFPLKNKKN
jgi:hypothetical protein